MIVNQAQIFTKSYRANIPSGGWVAPSASGVRAAIKGSNCCCVLDMSSWISSLEVLGKVERSHISAPFVGIDWNKGLLKQSDGPVWTSLRWSFGGSYCQIIQVMIIIVLLLLLLLLLLLFSLSLSIYIYILVLKPMVLAISLILRKPVCA